MSMAWPWHAQVKHVVVMGCPWKRNQKGHAKATNLYIKWEGPASERSLIISGKRSICCIHGWCQFDQLFQDVCEAGPHDWILKPALKHEICKILRAPLWKILPM